LAIGVLIVCTAACGSQPSGGTPASARPSAATIAVALIDEPTPAITLAPDSVARGERLTIVGSGWQPRISVAVSLRPSSTVIAIPLDMGRVPVDEQGRFTTTVILPDEVVPGEWSVSVSGGSRPVQIVAVPFEVIAPSVADATAATAVAATVTVLPTWTTTPTAFSPMPTVSVPTTKAVASPVAALPTEPPLLPQTDTPVPEAMPEFTQTAGPQPMRFPRGSSSITLTTLLSPGSMSTYVAGVFQGQILTVRVTPMANISIRDVWGQLMVAGNGTVQLAIPQTGSYLVAISGEDAIADMTVATVEISIPPLPTALPPSGTLTSPSPSPPSP
jgi:hypothetical protein